MAAGGSGGELARPESTGYGHTDWEEVDSAGLSDPREDVRHVGEDRQEPHEWGEARGDRHGDPGQSRAPAREPSGLIVPPPRWPLRTEGNMGGGFARATAKRKEERGMGAKTTTAAKDGGVPAGHRKIIDEVLGREDAKSTGDAVRMAESNPRGKEFARYQVPTDRGLKDIEIAGDRVKVRSESSYSFRKMAEDGADGLPDRVAPPGEVQAPADDGSMLHGPLPDEAPGAESGEEFGEAAEEQGLLLHVDIVASPPDGMEEEDVISILDEALLDPEIADAINAKLEGSGVSVRVLEVETYDEDEDDDEYDEYAEGDEMAEMPEQTDDEVAIGDEEIAE